MLNHKKKIESFSWNNGSNIEKDESSQSNNIETAVRSAIVTKIQQTKTFELTKGVFDHYYVFFV